MTERVDVHGICVHGGNVGIVNERAHKHGDGTGVQHVVGIEHDDDIAVRGLDAAIDRSRLAQAGRDDQVGATRGREPLRRIGGSTVDDDMFDRAIVLRADTLECLRKVRCRVQRRRDDAYENC